ncbi:MAG: EamA/RhaT family transporter, partial [Burkholderiales bacterium]
MRAYDAGRWLLLATLWSLQFLFLRVAVPVFGMAPVAEARALFAALFLLPWAVFFARQPLGLRTHWKD